jgi:uncharacterized protein (DUF58 family)
VYVKNYEEERDLNILFIIDDSASLAFGSRVSTKKETLTEIYFLLAQASILNGHSI